MTLQSRRESILIIEDNRDIAEMVYAYLEGRGYLVDYAGDGVTGLHLAVTREWDAIVLDLILPGIDGVALCRRLREDAQRDPPVLMLTARDTLEDKVEGLQAGADDYLVKPFEVEELEARLRALIRRRRGLVTPTVLRVADLVLDLGTLAVTRAGVEIAVTPIGYRILRLLMRASPRVVIRREIEREVWGDEPPDSDALRTHLCTSTPCASPWTGPSGARSSAPCRAPATGSPLRMNRRPAGLGRRLGRVFLLQAAFISAAAVIGVYAAATTIEEVLIRRALEEEAEHFWRRFSASVQFPAPDTRNLTGYLARGADRSAVPAPVAGLGTGLHDLDSAADFSVVHVTEQDGYTLFLVFDGERVSELALWFGLVPLAGALVILYLSSWLGYRLATRAVSPAIWLARQVRRLDPRAPDASAFEPQRLPPNADREILALARALAGLSRNVHEHIEREREFTRDASHELRTPLTVVRLAAGALRRGQGLDAESREAVARIERAVRDMEGMTEAFLLLARASDSRLSATAVGLNDIVARECEHARTMIADRPVVLESRIAEPVVVDADARVLAVLVGNLLRNAVQHTRAGQIEVRVQGDTLTIVDTGAGIPREELDAVFDPFVRAANASRGGHGVGLSIVKRLCDRFGWSVRLESTPGNGTRVRVRFPGARPPGAAAPPGAARDEAGDGARACAPGTD